MDCGGKSSGPLQEETFSSSVCALASHLISYPTVSAALEEWCAQHFPGTTGPLHVQVITDEEIEPADYDGSLPVADADSIRYRRVYLTWAGKIISEAENWYFPSRLPARIQAQLLDSNLPFGSVVSSLSPQRSIIDVLTKQDLLVRKDDAVLQCISHLARVKDFSPIDRFVLHIRALMSIENGPVIAELREHYRSELLDFTSAGVRGTR